MTSPTRDSPAKRNLMIEAAIRLFAERGFEGAEIKVIARASGAAIGSVTHFLGKKPSVAAKVYDIVSTDLLSVIQLGLERGGRYLDRSIPDVIRDCYDWRVANPDRVAVLGNLRPIVCPPGGGAVSIEDQLEQALGLFMKGFIDRDQATPFTPRQFYALILAPVMCASIHPSDDVPDNGELWIERLGQVALAAVALEKGGKGPRPLRTRKTFPTSRSDDRQPYLEIHRLP